LTVAAAVFVLDHVTTRPVNTLLLASRVVAVSWVVWPAVRLVVLPVTVTVATGAGGGNVTLTFVVALTPSLVAVIVAAPGPAPTTSPEPDTVATCAALLDQLTGRSVTTAFAASLTTAPSCIV
jgi:hypothetical protein